jgi:DtxR family Mn-dependent transcriptional regulator
MVKRLEKADLVRVDDTVIVLTDDGRELATAVVRRHRLAERFLTDVLGLTWTEAHHEAGKWEHVISPSVEAALDRLLGEPTTCPHGNPIPGSSYREPDTRNLSDVGVGESFTVSRIPEELEFIEGLLQFLEDASLMPGEKGRVTASGGDGLTVEIGGGRVDVESFAANRILVTTA